jgi:hypothetical protein
MHIITYVCILLFMPFVALGENIGDLKAKAQAGDGEAQHNLAFAYYFGKGVEKNRVLPSLEGKMGKTLD